MAGRFWLKKVSGRLQARSAAVRVDVLTGYARWAESYAAEAHNPLMALEEAAMLSLLPDATGQTCLDLACGSGRYLRLLRARGAAPLYGCDYSAEMLARAGATGLIRSPFLALPFPNETFDLITCGLAVGHERNLDHLLAEAARLLRPGGRLLYSDFHPFAALLGWQRTFTANGATFSLEHYPHLYSDHLRAGQTAGLTIEAVLEPVGGAHVPPQFAQLPVVLVIRAVKEGGGAGERGSGGESG
ncbi:MAG: class I SAM-dependent methyltransferase [Anaerolineae bacterium]|nr:class I SAM-dependent methyltransferase [Anaerolineae bacterium]